MYRVIITAAPTDRSRLEKKIFGLGASSVSVEKNGDNIRLCALTEDPDIITSRLNGMEIIVEELAEDWKYGWMKNRGPALLTDRIYVIPEDEQLPVGMDESGIHIISLDPRDAFGDGHHPTTKLCATLLQDYLRGINPEDMAGLRVLDMGTGTGILALAANRLGITAIDAVDNDMDSIQRAGRNISMNHAQGEITLHHCDAAGFVSCTPYDIITANLLSSIIEECIDRLGDLLAPGGVMIVSGVSRRWNTRMKNFFERKGYLVLKNPVESDWCAYLLKHADPGRHSGE